MTNTKNITIPERFDFSAHQQFTTEYEACIGDPAIKIISLDFSRVSYLDSSALGMMVLLHRKSLASNKKVTINNATGTAKDILDMANFQNLFEFM
jgi:HptB-dependent secretion and biofilm anti anti-sigma factor